jgi:hypothetical protein
MILPTCKDVKQVTTALPSRQLERVLLLILRLDQGAWAHARLDACQQLVVYLYEWLMHLGFVGEDQARWLLGKMGGALKDYADTRLEPYFDDAADRLTTFTLTISEQRYAIWPGVEVWYDLYAERLLTGLPEPCVTHITCDVVSMFIRKQRWLKSLRGGKDAGSEYHAAGQQPGGG